jgi:demethylspheroidene O-methyltransferase
LAKSNLRQQQLSFFGGNFFEDQLPTGADIVTLIRVIFDHDDQRVLQLLKGIHQTLPVGGKLLIAEPMADTPEIPAMGQAYFGFYLLAMGRGRPRSAQEISDLLYQAGFVACRKLKNKMVVNAQIILAEA